MAPKKKKVFEPPIIKEEPKPKPKPKAKPAPVVDPVIAQIDALSARIDKLTGQITPIVDLFNKKRVRLEPEGK